MQVAHAAPCSPPPNKRLQAWPVTVNVAFYLRPMRTTGIILLTTLLLACGSGEQGSAEPVAAQDTTSTTLLSVDLAPQDMPLFVEIGDANVLGVESPAVEWNEERGCMEVMAGEHFAIVITEEPGDMARLKADLDRDLLQTHTVLEESPEKLVYRSQFPDQDLVYIHFYQVVEVDGRTFTVQDKAEGRFNEADVARMARAVRTQRAV